MGLGGFVAWLKGLVARLVASVAVLRDSVANDGKQNGEKYVGGITLYMALASLVAVSAGLIFGYEIGVTSGLSFMDDFLQEFFPEMVRAKKENNNYCHYDNQGFQAFTSSLFLAALITAMFAQYSTKHLGRTKTMLIAGICVLKGAILNVYAVNLPMLILGRIMLGCGIGAANQVVPLYLSEVAPYKWRGYMNYMTFGSATHVGVWFANFVNYVVANGGENFSTPHGAWRISLGMAIVPAIVLTLGGMFLPETAQSLIERGKPDGGRKALERIRGSSDVDAEYEDIVEVSGVANTVKHPWRNLLELRNRPQLVLAMLMPFFQITTGVTLVLLYAPQFIQMIGFGGKFFPLLFATNFAQLLMMGNRRPYVNRKERRSTSVNEKERIDKLPYLVIMFICMMGVGIILQTKLPLEGSLEKGWTYVVLVLVVIFTLSFGDARSSVWGWTLGCTVPSEIFALETGSAGQSVVVYVTFFSTFCMAQVMPTMLCHFQYGTFYLFSALIVVMIIFLQLFFPSIEDLHVEDLPKLWNHWFWKRYAPQEFSEPKTVVDAISEAKNVVDAV